MDYRKKENFTIANIPKQFTPEDRGKNECCCSFLVVADIETLDTWKNDVTGFYAKKTEVADTISWSITKCGIEGNLTLQGTVATFPNEPLGVGYIFDWRSYLFVYGSGEYQISINYTIAGISASYVVGKYGLIQYNPNRLDKTIRVKSEFRSYFLKENFDFTGSNFVDTIRVNGIFGFRKPGTVVTNHVDIGRRVLKSTRENLNTYELKTDPVKECSSSRLLDFHFLNEDGCYISDYNAGNHSYKFLDIPVVVEAVDDPEYLGASRYAEIIAKFGDRVKDAKSYYNV